MATKAETASESFDSPSRYGRSTLVTAGIALGILVCTAPLARGGMDAGPLAVLAIGLALLAGIMMAACLIKLAMESLIIVDRPKAAVAALAYFQALGQGRWEVAWDCLSSVAKDGGELVRPAIPALDLEGSRVSLFCAEHLAEYWSDLVGVGGMRTRGIRSMGTQVTSVREVSEGVAVVFVRLDVHLELASARLGGSARRSREVLSSRNSIAITGGWPAYRRNGRWFLLAAGFPAGARITRLG